MLILQEIFRVAFFRKNDIFNKYKKIIVNARPNYGIL